MQPNHIHPPVPQIEQIMISEAIVGAIVDKIGMKRVDLIYCINSMIHRIPIILIHE